MIQAHVLDSWTRPADRAAPLFQWAIVVAGFGAPLFLFLAGVAAVLSARTRSQRSGSDKAGSRAVQRRGWEIFGLAFLFRLQAFVVNPGSPAIGLLKVDILNIMGPAIACAGFLWGAARTNAARLSTFALTMAVLTFLTPVVRTTPYLGWLPDPVEWYVRPSPGRTNFTLFPWAGFLFAGAAVGVLLDGRRGRAAERNLHGLLVAAGAALALAAFLASYLPSPYTRSDFWTTSPAFFFLRAGILVVLAGAAWFWQEMPPLTLPGSFRPMQRFGRSSLFVYWIHVEMVYSWMSQPLHKSLSLPGSMAAFAAFTLFLFALVILKQRYWDKGRLRASRSHAALA